MKSLGLRNKVISNMYSQKGFQGNNFLFGYHVLFSVYIWIFIHCEVPGNVHISATEGIGNSWAREESQRAQMLRKCMTHN